MDLQISWRNLWRNPRRTIIILTAIIIGIVSMLVLSAFGRGMMQGMVKNSIDNLVGHIRIQDPQYRIDPAIDHRIPGSVEFIADITKELPEDARLVKRMKVDGLLSTSREHIGIVIVGIEPDSETGVSFIGKPLASGEKLRSDDKNGLLIGQALLERIDTKLGKKVVLLSQDTAGEGSSRAFRIRGTYRTELRDTEKRYVFVNLATLQNMLGIVGDVTEISINLESGSDSHTKAIDQLVVNLNTILEEQGYEATGWRQLLPAIHAYIEMFDFYMLIWFVVVFIAMGFGLANTMLMAVYERMREFGLQRALGMRSSKIIRVVLVEVFLLLVIGVLIANGSTLFLTSVVFKSGIDLSLFTAGVEMFGISRIIYPILTFKDVLMANGVVIILGLLVGLYPALHASKFTPMETMRYL